MERVAERLRKVQFSAILGLVRAVINSSKIELNERLKFMQNSDMNQ